MKRMIMWAIGLLVMVSAANAQLKKGDLIVGGNIGLTLNIGESEGFSDETDVDVTFSLTPGVTYMLTDNWYIGGELGVSVGPGSTSTFTLGPNGGWILLSVLAMFRDCSFLSLTRCISALRSVRWDIIQARSPSSSACCVGRHWDSTMCSDKLHHIPSDGS